MLTSGKQGDEYDARVRKGGIERGPGQQKLPKRNAETPTQKIDVTSSLSLKHTPQFTNTLCFRHDTPL
jgi:hypothetical protein